MVLLLLLLSCIEIPVVNVKSVDQAPRSLKLCTRCFGFMHALLTLNYFVTF